MGLADLFDFLPQGPTNAEVLGFLKQNWPEVASIGGTALEAIYGPNEYDPSLAAIGRAAQGVGQSALLRRALNKQNRINQDYGDQTNQTLSSLLNMNLGDAASAINSSANQLQNIKVGPGKLNFDIGTEAIPTQAPQALGTLTPNVGPTQSLYGTRQQASRPPMMQMRDLLPFF